MTVGKMPEEKGERSASRLKMLVLAVLALVLLTACGRSSPHHLVVLGDPHSPGRNLEAKEEALREINSWSDVELVAAVGDICALYGSEAEYAAAGDFFAQLQKPLRIIAGNHDFFYATPTGAAGGLIPGSSETQAAKLRKFAATFGLASLSSSMRIGDYLLIFLSADNPEFLIGISDTQLAWLRRELADHRENPTLIFFHAPLNGTLRDYRHWVNKPSSTAQPEEQLHAILAENPQVFLWVSGHTHTPLQEESYASPVNLYDGRVTNIHNTDMNKGEIWSNSLYLYPNEVKVRTYSHREQAWLPQFDRIISLPRPKGR